MRTPTHGRMALLMFLIVTALIVFTGSLTHAQPAKPNILVIMGDDIGYWNISAYNRGMMGYRTPNIDRIANEGAIFTDYYGQQSCTAGRAAFITGQSPMRTGLLKVGLPAAKEGLSEKDPTLAEAVPGRSPPPQATSASDASSEQSQLHNNRRSTS